MLDQSKRQFKIKLNVYTVHKQTRSNNQDVKLFNSSSKMYVLTTIHLRNCSIIQSLKGPRLIKPEK